MPELTGANCSHRISQNRCIKICPGPDNERYPCCYPNCELNGMKFSLNNDPASLKFRRTIKQATPESYITTETAPEGDSGGVTALAGKLLQRKTKVRRK
jgi:hypothetical protein